MTVLLLAGCPAEKVQKTPDLKAPDQKVAQTLEQAPLKRALHDRRIAELTRKKDDKALIEALRQALLLWPGDADLHLKLSAALKRAGKRVESEAAARMARSLQGKDLDKEPPVAPTPAAPTRDTGDGLAPTAQRQLEAAQDLEQRGEADRAAAAYRALLGKFPRAGEAYLGLGRILVGKGAAGHAEGMFIKALTISPAHAGELVRSLSSQGKGHVAHAALGKVVEQVLKRPNRDTVFMQRLGVALRDTGQFDLSEKLLRACLKARPDDPVLKKDLETTLRLKKVVK